MKDKSLFYFIGPIMVSPSSLHTTGAARTDIETRTLIFQR